MFNGWAPSSTLLNEDELNSICSFLEAYLWQAKVDKSILRIVCNGQVAYTIGEYCIRYSRIHIQDNRDK